MSDMCTVISVYSYGYVQFRYMHTVRGTCSQTQVGWLLEFLILATSKIISGQIPICVSSH